MSSEPFRKILIATDFSPSSERALALGTEMARKMGVPVLVCHAFDLPIPIVNPREIVVPDPYILACRKRADELLEEAVGKVREQGVEAESLLTEVPADAAIVAAAQEKGCDLIVMGTRGNRGLKHLLLGSVADRTLRAAPCAVLTVHADD